MDKISLVWSFIRENDKINISLVIIWLSIFFKNIFDVFIKDKILLSISLLRLKCFFLFNNSNIFELKLSTFEVKILNISLKYISEYSNVIYNIWNDVAFVSNLLTRLNAELKIIFDLSESSLIKLSILKTYFQIIYVYMC